MVGEIVGGLVFALLLLAMAFCSIPAIIAKKRKHRQFAAITALCVLAFLVSPFVGPWAFIGWAIAMIWSLTDQESKIKVVVGATGPKGDKGDPGKDAVPISKTGTLWQTPHHIGKDGNSVLLSGGE